MQKLKLIEVSLPLEAINRESAREKSIRHGHPSTLHLWWARRPLAAARAVLFAQLVDDPSARPEEFPTEADQRRERERLHRLIERLVVWENVRDEKLFDEAHTEILKSTDGHPPVVLDPFAGGGTIPLEAQRLGLESHASDLNPVAVLINKALIEIPPKFHGRSPVFPGLATSQIRAWKGTEGLAADVRAYAQWMREEAEVRVGSLYPTASLPDGREIPVIAWLWARTATCPNPACAIEMPLVRSWWLGKKKGKEAYIIPSVESDPAHPGQLRVAFSIGHTADGSPTEMSDGTVTRTGATCLACQSSVPLSYVRAEGKAGRLGATLMAVVAEGVRQRIYLPGSEIHRAAADVLAPEALPDGDLPEKALGFRVGGYGMRRFTDLFTNRQLVTLTTLSDLVEEARVRVLTDALAVGIPEGQRLDDSGTGATAYADAVATYLGLALSRISSTNSSLCRWNSSPSKESVSDTFGRQALSMIWDFAEGNPWCSGPCNFSWSAGWIAKAIEWLPAKGTIGVVRQADAKQAIGTEMISTDPPYYDNIGYADLSDFFYVWQRRSLRTVHPGLFGTVLAPKADELVANPFRHAGSGGANAFFESGFQEVFKRARGNAHEGFPITVYYAFKQSESNAEGTSSSGWETLLEGMIGAGWTITATWPMRSERIGRMRDVGSNALASSIVLALRPRSLDASITDRRGFISAMESELPDALRRLQQGQVAPVDLPQAAIGPGMAVFSRFSGVLEPDGTRMTVRSALVRINEILDQVLNEQEGDFDATTRFALAWYRQHGYSIGKFGDADNLARARNTSVDLLDRDGILTSRAGSVQLIKPGDLSWDYDMIEDSHTSTWEALHHLIKILERDGIGPAGDFLKSALTRTDGAVDADLIKELAHLLFRIAEGSSATQDALSFNSIVTSWPETVDVARATAMQVEAQGAFEFDEDV